MSLNHVILGLLKRESMTGYDIKKIIQNTPFMYWSGNNNQIYKAFVELLKEGYVTKEVEHQEGAPSKNIYTITGDGLGEFHNWLISATDAPAIKKQFLIKLALANQLERGELQSMLSAYEEEIRLQAIVAEREYDKCYFAGYKDTRNQVFGDLIRENILSFYSNELAWLQKVKECVADFVPEENRIKEAQVDKERKEGKVIMKHQVKENNGKKYLYITGSDVLINQEQDVNDIISLCWENDVNLVIMEGEILSEDFIRLRTGLAGTVIQKLTNYNIKAAITLKDGQKFPERFQEMASEYSKGSTFRIFTGIEDAISWL